MFSIYLLPGSHHGFLKAMQLLNKKFTLFGAEEFLVKDNNKGFEEFIEGARVLAPWATDEYRKRFEDRFGYSGGFFYTPAFYDFLNLLTDITADQQNLKGESLVNAMRFSGTRVGVSGKYSLKISKKGVHSYSFPIAVYQVKEGKTLVEQVIEF